MSEENVGFGSRVARWIAEHWIGRQAPYTLTLNDIAAYELPAASETKLSANRRDEIMEQAVSWKVARAAPASAATPANQACVGESLSALASNQPSNGSFGAAVVGFAQMPNTAHPGLGDGVQVFQAGGVLDTLIPNTCND